MDELAKAVSRLEKVIQRLVKEVEELRTEVKELKDQKQKGNLSEYQTYYLNRQESQLRIRQSKLEQLRNIVNSSSSNFPTGLVVGGGILVVLGLVAVLVIRRKRKKSN